jgi:hypothetical protein
MIRLIGTLLLSGFTLLAGPCEEGRLRFAGQEIIYTYQRSSASKSAPLLILLPGDPVADLTAAKTLCERWQMATVPREWHLLVPWDGSARGDCTDDRMKALEAIVLDACRLLPVDTTRIYLAGYAASSSQVFYAVSRMPDLWAAALAFGGSPQPAIDTNCFFGVNASQVPFLWVLRKQEQEALAALRNKLAAKGFSPTIPSREDFTVKDALDWLEERVRPTLPSKVDCETGNLSFARCYWAEITKFDITLRNDVLDFTRVQAGARAYLDLGEFGFSLTASGPGILVTWLPNSYKGPLKLNDRIVALAGRPIRDVADYQSMMEGLKEERSVGIIIERDGKRQRVETRILLPKSPGEDATVRLQAEYLPQFDEVQIISRGVAGLRLRLPSAWIPCRINWNGEEAAKIDRAGCWILSYGSGAGPCDR